MKLEIPTPNATASFFDSISSLVSSFCEYWGSLERKTYEFQGDLGSEVPNNLLWDQPMVLVGLYLLPILKQYLLNFVSPLRMFCEHVEEPYRQNNYSTNSTNFCCIEGIESSFKKSLIRTVGYQFAIISSSNRSLTTTQRRVSRWSPGSPERASEGRGESLLDYMGSRPQLHLITTATLLHIFHQPQNF